ncbi:hypothetical protein [Saccharibacillus sacchari]|uniref:Uncharacterized protein n=1 Tax=Saccharibacillus sacchari TaxID=456493 RepID=A0ACC6PI02_9BACL
MSVRLIVVEGLPGSGKSTTAREVARLLKTAQPEQKSEDSQHSEEQAVEATIEVLRARRLMEDNILAELNIPVFKLDNSGYDNLRRESRLNEMFACFSE